MHVYEYVPMLLTVSLHMLVLTNHFVLALDDKQQILQEITDGNNVKHDEPKLRMTRSMRDIIALIKSAAEVSTRSKQYRKFVKTGSVPDAIDDFMKLKPTGIKKRKFSTDAWVGDVQIQLQKTDISQSRQPSIRISYPGDVAAFKIVYQEGDIRPTSTKLSRVFVNQHYGVVQAFQDSDEQFRMPTGVNVTPGPRTINVHWNPPSSKEQLTFCAIEYKKIPDPSPQYPLTPILIPVNKDASQYTIRGLRSRTDYSVRLLCFYGSERGPTTEWIRAPAQCDYGMLKCQSGECIWKSGRCDRRYDCPDQSDEKNCNYTCETNQFMCTTELAECISERLVCDGTADCADNSDERDCNKDMCDPNEFQCSNKRCIPKSWVCDGELDCEQGEDEHWENRNIAGAGSTCDYTARCKVCPTKFPNGRVQHDCGVDTDCLCSFECDAGFKPHPYFVNSAIGHVFVPRRLLCQDGAYKTGYEHIGLDISGLCIAPGADCQETIPHGRVPYSVWTNTGYLMEMKCDQNYRPRALALEQAHTFTCIDKKWVFKTTMYDSSITADTVCVLNTTTDIQTCPRSIPNGHVPDNCMVNCEPVCNHGYHLVGAQQREYRVVTCEDGQWVAPMELSPTKDYSVENLCFPDGGMRCSETIPNAEVTSSTSTLTDNGLSINWDLDFVDLPSGSILNRNMRKPIYFKCNEGYRKHRGVPYIECVAGRIRTWQERFGVGLETMCIPDRTK